MTNLTFRTIRKCYGFEWETFFDERDQSYLAVCHTFSGSVHDKTWDGLWEKIVSSSKNERKKKIPKKDRSYDR